MSHDAEEQPAAPELKARLQIAVIGAAEAEERLLDLATDVGRRIARAGATLISGGRGGVMTAASRGARLENGLAVGILPGDNAATSPANPFVQIAIFTGTGQARNLAVVLSAAAAIAIGGGWGTLSEIALARKHGVPVVLLESWQLQSDHANTADLPRTSSAEEAVDLALAIADHQRLG